MCQRSTCSVRGIFVDIGRGISEERYQTSYHVRNLKNGNGWLFLCDTWLTYLKKLQFMVTETHQISNLRSQGVSEEILSDLVRKMLPSLKFFHFQYAPGKCVRRHYFARYCKNVSHQYYATNQDTKPHILS